MTGSHKWQLKGFQLPSRGEKKEGKKKGVGEGKDIVATKRFSVATWAW